jgi:hypothetical protein
MSHINNISFERISEEAHGDVLSFLTDESATLSDLGFELLFNGSSLYDFPVAGVCDYAQLTESVRNSVEPNELDGYLVPLNSQNPSFECDNNRALMNNSPVQTVEKGKKLHPNTKQIELSPSVGVGLPQKTIKPSHKIYIVHPLEEFFRPRYKSDYFAQNGKSRKPRYVADRAGTHFITLKVPIGVRGQSRVDWLTIADKSGDLYSMPYRFQQSNESFDVPDRNPIYININADKNGMMKVYLVLIKSKQDELKTLQPLKPFHPFKDVLGIPTKTNMQQIYPLNPKQLIQEYQLDRSQLAFTFCALGSDGQSRIEEWDTTVYSTVLTEMPPENAKSKAIACPKCTHRFHVSIGGGVDDQDSVQETVTNKRKTYQYANEGTIKKQNSFQNHLTIHN